MAGGKSVEDLVRELLSRRNPHGYYVIPVRIDAVSELVRGVDGVVVEEIADTALVMVRSRSAAERIARAALARGALALEGEEQEPEEGGVDYYETY
ncbi:MAG: hypothetical protein LRS49_03790 [Desulfurococcales archaeon]|nr:hypothetical protein [Desulfurococcales archaeon]